jgi:hypothetical protein
MDIKKMSLLWVEKAHIAYSTKQNKWEEIGLFGDVGFEANGQGEVIDPIFPRA